MILRGLPVKNWSFYSRKYKEGLERVCKKYSIPEPEYLRLGKRMYRLGLKQLGPLDLNRLKSTHFRDITLDTFKEYVSKLSSRGVIREEVLKSPKGRKMTRHKLNSRRLGDYYPEGIEYLTYLLEAIEVVLCLERGSDGFLYSQTAQISIEEDDPIQLGFLFTSVADLRKDLYPDLPRFNEAPRIPIIHM
jgi:hypothetical protein